MLRLLLTTSLLTLAGAAAAAQDVPVRAGDHPSFSRLVLYFDERPDWRLGRVEGGYELRTGEPDLRFDDSEVFDRIARDRIARLEPGSEPGALRIEVECACSVDAFAFQSDALVIDVIERAPDPASPFEVALDSGAPLVPRAAPTLPAYVELLPLPLLPGSFPIMEAAMAGPRRPVSTAVDPSAPFKTPAPEPQPVEAPRPTPQTAPQPKAIALSPTALDARLAETAKTMLREVGRAAAQGLVEPDMEETEAALAEAESALANRHVTVTTSIARDLASRPQRPLTADGLTCIEPERLDVAAWGSESGNGAALAEFRENLLAEFDEANPESVEALARHYVYLTFGAEARALLAAYPEGETDLLLALADIVDGKTSEAGPLADQISCDGPSALWAAFARPTLSTGDGIATDALLREFARLPVHIRRHLGPDLAEKFLAMGDENTVQALRNAMNRAPGARVAAQELLAARIDAEAGAPDEAALERLAAENTQTGTEALILLLAEQVEAGAVNPNLVEQAAALAYERKGTPAAEGLKAAEIAGRIALDQFEAALAAVDAGPLDAATEARLRGSAYEAMAERMDDAAFLPAAFAADAKLGTEGPELTARRALAKRLLALRFPEQARALVGREDVLPQPEDRLILAEAAFQAERPEIAESYLVGLPAPEAEALRAAYSDEPAIAPLEPAESGDAPAPEGILAEGRALLDASQSLRSRLDERLQTLTPQG